MKDRKFDCEDGRQDIDNDEIQSSLLAHYIQTYLSHSTNENTCGCLPIPFERASSHSWIRPYFDSDILEEQFKTSSANHFLRRFRFGLTYLIVISLLWLCFSLYRYPSIFYIPIIFGILLVVLIFSYYYSNRSLYKRQPLLFSTTIAIVLACGALAFCLFPSSSLSHFTVVTYTVMVIYSIFLLPPYISLIICVILTAAFNALEYFGTDFSNFPQGFFVRLVCLLCTNVIGFHINVMVHIRMRGTFMKVGQRLLVRRQLEAEKQLKEKMIHSVMPPKVATWLLNPNPSLSDSTGQRPSADSTGDIRTLFRPFNMVRMENVSILFADIVGFTRMSSNKTAEQIVDILNDLFNRFDDLCHLSGCEKISTLGDCYYCVSGCPEPREDHAKCCVEMGLGMIEAIQEFDLERSEEVNMRVGVHTGTVLCGVVGTRRFKFDVWSNDVSFANKLESTGLAGRVHVSEQTVAFLEDAYQYEEYSCSTAGVKTYLIVGREPVPICQVRMPHPPSPLVGTPTPSRKRMHSYNSGQKRPHYLSLITGVRSKFSSLPNVLTGAGSSANVPQTPRENRHSTPRKASSIRWQFPLPKSWRPADEILNMEVMEHLKVPTGETTLTPEEEVSLCPSATSRKDSGIKSTSRRSSIQQQIYIMNGVAQQELSHRVSGYFTSSRSSLPHSESECDTSVPCRMPGEDGLGTCFYSLRKQSDLQLIRCVRDITQRSYFVKVPLTPVTLTFRNKNMEKDYRQHAHQINENVGDSPVTLSTPRYDTLLDIVVSTIVLMGVTSGLLLLQPPGISYALLAFLSLFLQMAALALCCVYLYQGPKQPSKTWSALIISLFSDWYKWHCLGIVLVSLPIILTIAGFAYDFGDSMSTHKSELAFLTNTTYNLPNIEFFDYYYTFLLLVSLTHFCNFIQLNSFLKGVIAVICIVVFASLIYVEQGEIANKSFVTTVYFAKFLSENIFLTPADGLGPRQFCCAELVSLLTDCQDSFCYEYGRHILDHFNNTLTNSSIVYATANGHKIMNFLAQTQGAFPHNWADEFSSAIESFISYDYYELLLNILIVLLLVILLNRDLETNYRASYFFNVESNKDKIHVQYLKNQADMLLENIIPKHVSEELKNRAKYCENHTDVGIIFASIVNFNMLYEETYSGGKEYLRYLNELISDFDELLTKFPNVEKIKTIGSTFMAASGLNPELRKKNAHSYAHIFELMEFAKEMYKVLDDFNSDLLGFTLVLRVGFNIGEVTAGVIGSSKLLYDIWGDTVNVASRMDSTGVEGRIQVPFSCLKYLEERYLFEQRGSVFVKGKGDIIVYLLDESSRIRGKDHSRF